MDRPGLSVGIQLADPFRVDVLGADDPGGESLSTLRVSRSCFGTPPESLHPASPRIATNQATAIPAYIFFMLFSLAQWGETPFPGTHLAAPKIQRAFCWLHHALSSRNQL
jgi:hypothetical protein